MVYLKIVAGTETAVRIVKGCPSEQANYTETGATVMLSLLLWYQLTEIALSEPTCFTDSKVSLYWMKGTDKEWKPFVQNRVNEIRRLVGDTVQGRADLLSLGITPLELSRGTLWLCGPEWLADPETDFNKEELRMPDESLQEMRS